MATAKVFYFSAGGIEMTNVGPLDNKNFERLFPGVKGKRYDSFSKWVGFPPGVPWKKNGDGSLPIERIIYFKKNPSLHKCSAKCQNATGPNCECSCRGKNHGAGNVL